jgi:uncharacterized protein YndB with AHSA1/START domain
MIDVATQINAVTRTVGSRALEDGEAKTVLVRQTYDATVEDVWDACTTADRIARWFLPVKGDLRLGGRYHLKGNAEGEVLECEPPRRLRVTWEYAGDISWVEVRLAPAEDGQTTFELEHTAHVDAGRWAEFGPGAVGIGWDMTLLGLAQHLQGGEISGPEEGALWAASDEGRDFMTRSGERWHDAQVSAGEDAAAARAAADRTIAAYTAQPPSEGGQG